MTVFSKSRLFQHPASLVAVSQVAASKPGRGWEDPTDEVTKGDLQLDFDQSSLAAAIRRSTITSDARLRRFHHCYSRIAREQPSLFANCFIIHFCKKR
jgi:hypothetical protein